MAFSITDLINGAGQEANPDGRPDTHFIDVDRLVPSEGNFYSMENIHELADAIELAGGVMQSLLVVPLPEGRYKIISGHRRHRAVLLLMDQGQKKYRELPCTILKSEKDAQRQEMQEELLLILTNSQREKTEWDKIQEVQRTRAVLEKMKQSGILMGRMREKIAEILNTSPAQVGRMEAISKNLIPELQEEIQEGRMGISAAYELSVLPKEEQERVCSDRPEARPISYTEAKQKRETALLEKPAVPEENGEPENIPGQVELESVTGVLEEPVAVLPEPPIPVLQSGDAPGPEPPPATGPVQEETGKPEAAAEESKATFYDEIQSMSLPWLAAFICKRCGGAGRFCDLWQECSSAGEVEREGVCSDWLNRRI